MIFYSWFLAVEITSDEEYSKANFDKFKSLRSAFKKDGKWCFIYRLNIRHDSLQRCSVWVNLVHLTFHFWNRC